MMVQQSLTQISSKLLNAPSITINRDNTNQITLSGTINTTSVWQQLYLRTFPVLIAYSSDRNNFYTVYDLVELNSNDSILDIYYS